MSNNSKRHVAIKKANGLEYTFSDADLKNMDATTKAAFTWQTDENTTVTKSPPVFVQDAMTKQKPEKMILTRGGKELATLPSFQDAELKTDNQPAKRGRKSKKDA